MTTSSKPVLCGKAVGRAIVSGKVAIVKSLADGGKVNPGDIIVADITNPDWNRCLRRRSVLVTNKEAEQATRPLLHGARHPRRGGHNLRHRDTERRAGDYGLLCTWR